MKLTKSEYNKIRNDPWIKELIDEWLIPQINKSDSERLKDKQASMKWDQELSNELLKKAENIRSSLVNEPELSRILGIDPIKVERKIAIIKEYYKTTVENRRASPKKPIFSVLILIFNRLADMGLGQTKQVDFIYTLYKENNFENYATTNEDVKKALRDRIRKDQEKAMK
jgi:hypothetical protein|tara:strand:- start:546 stop:1055 length:510 start_codon:yes stop_codon:yes gene_type:complete